MKLIINKTILLLLCAIFVMSQFVLCFAVSGEQVQAYTLDENGEKNYTIQGDRYIYQVDSPYEKSIGTFETWIMLPQDLADEAVGGVIFGNYFYHDNSTGYYPGCVDFAVSYKGNFYLYWNNGEYIYTFASADLRTGKWTHVALTIDTNAIYFYVDGVLTETVAVSLSPSICKVMSYCVGSDWNNWFVSKQWGLSEKSAFQGKIRQITLYDTCISQAQIKEDMQKNIISSDSKDSSLMANYYFTEKWASEKVILDNSANGNNCNLATYDCYVPVEDQGEYDYSFLVVPDMQAMTYWKRDNFTQQSQWIVDNVEKLNTKFVLYVGDMVESKYSVNAEKTEEEWQFASKTIQMLDGKVPYVFCLGNHDYDNWATITRETVMYNKYFKYSDYSTRSYFGGAFEKGSMDNYYCLINVGDIEYLIFSLELYPRYNVLNWVDAITEAHPKARTIILTHYILDPTAEFANTSNSSKYAGVRSNGKNGQEMWDNWLSKRSNIFMTFNGHVCSDEIVIRDNYGDNGNLVRSVLVDAQGAMFTSAMNTLLICKVNEKTKTMSFCYYSPEYDACYNYQSQFTLSFADENNPAVGKAVTDNTK